MTADPNTHLGPVKILTDEVESYQFLDIGRYSDTIARIVKGSEPNFALGVFGEWGTGKTTLMKQVEGKLRQQHNILTVWFNAWRYEREEQFAVIALLKTIAYEMDKHEIYRGMKKVLLRGAKIFGKDLLRQVASQFISDHGIEEFEKGLYPKIEQLDEIDKDTIYFDGINKIEGEITKIINKHPDSRVVVFIDDLDRCSPKKALEVFESIKVFLDLKGFIYILGLSQETIDKIITGEYEKSGIKGEHYIRKIIQIPIIVPYWSTSDLEQLIEQVISKKLDVEYARIITDNKDMIASAVESNPREIKRFINNFIVSYEIFRNSPNVKPKELLMVQALKMRWRAFFDEISFNEPYLTEVKRILELSDEEQESEFLQIISKKNKNETLSSLESRIIQMEDKLWGVLKEEKDTFIGATLNWKAYHRASESTKDISSNELSPWYKFLVTCNFPIDQNMDQDGIALELNNHKFDAAVLRTLSVEQNKRLRVNQIIMNFFVRKDTDRDHIRKTVEHIVSKYVTVTQVLTSNIIPDDYNTFNAWSDIEKGRGVKLPESNM